MVDHFPYLWSVALQFGRWRRARKTWKQKRSRSIGFPFRRGGAEWYRYLTNTHGVIMWISSGIELLTWIWYFMADARGFSQEEYGMIWISLEYHGNKWGSMTNVNQPYGIVGVSPKCSGLPQFWPNYPFWWVLPTKRSLESGSRIGYWSAKYRFHWTMTNYTEY